MYLMTGFHRHQQGLHTLDLAGRDQVVDGEILAALSESFEGLDAWLAGLDVRGSVDFHCTAEDGDVEVLLHPRFDSVTSPRIPLPVSRVDGEVTFAQYGKRGKEEVAIRQLTDATKEAIKGDRDAAETGFENWRKARKKPVIVDISSVDSTTGTTVASGVSGSAKVNVASLASRGSGTGVTHGQLLSMKNEYVCSPAAMPAAWSLSVTAFRLSSPRGYISGSGRQSPNLKERPPWKSSWLNPRL